MNSTKTESSLSYKQALEQLQSYIEKEEFKGYDPYDTLKSKIPFKLFGRLIPILAIQFQKRNPINIRPLLGIKKDYNPKGLGLLLYGYCSLQELYPNNNYKKQIDFLFNHLKTHYSKGYSGYCWGYNFDWASSNKYIEAYSPNVVVTAFVAKGIFKYYELTKVEEALTILKSVSQFILKDLPKTETAKGICFSYTTLGVDCCYNASLLAASVLAKLYRITKEESLKQIAQQAVDYVVDKQHADGHWNYSIDETGKERSQIDFHQGYVIDCIMDITTDCDIKNDNYTNAIEKGTAYYKKEQFFDNGQSKWRLPKIFPTEIHNQTQGIITFLKTTQLHPSYGPFAKVIADWTLDNMRDEKGYFYYQKLKYHTIKIPYMRWSQAWVFIALIELLKMHETEKNG